MLNSMAGSVHTFITDRFKNTDINITAVSKPVKRHQMVRIGQKFTGKDSKTY